MNCEINFECGGARLQMMSREVNDLCHNPLHPVYIITELRSILMTDSSLATFLIPFISWHHSWLLLRNKKKVTRFMFNDQSSSCFILSRHVALLIDLSQVITEFEWWSEKKVHRIVLLKVSLHFSLFMLTYVHLFLHFSEKFEWEKRYKHVIISFAFNIVHNFFLFFLVNYKTKQFKFK